jgi:hypothetical protein
MYMVLEARVYAAGVLCRDCLNKVVSPINQALAATTDPGQKES